MSYVFYWRGATPGSGGLCSAFPVNGSGWYSWSYLDVYELAVDCANIEADIPFVSRTLTSEGNSGGINSHKGDNSGFYWGYNSIRTTPHNWRYNLCDPATVHLAL